MSDDKITIPAEAFQNGKTVTISVKGTIANTPRPTLDQQLFDLSGNENRDELIHDFQRTLEDLQVARQRGQITADEYEARKESAGQGVELAIFELWREVTWNE